MAEPILDIVMLVHDLPGWADLAIRAVEHHTKNPYRLIVVNMASTEPKTRAMLEDVSKRGHTVVHLNENRSFSNGVNAGVRAGHAKNIVVLNDDALVTEGWDGAMLNDLAVKTTGLVGARSNYAAGAQGDPSWLADREPPFLVFVCVGIRRSVWDAVGPMDEETFDGFSCEDLDYSWRVKHAGYMLKVGKAYVLHAGSRTIAAKFDGAEAQIRNNAKYTVRLEDKWGREFVGQKTKLQQRCIVFSYHAEEWTRVAFMKSMLGMRRYSGTAFEYGEVSRAPIHAARQIACDWALDNGFDWMVQLDDDALFPEDTLQRLMAHQKDIVCALAYQRKPPHATCAFELQPANEKGEQLMGTALEGIENTGLRRVDISGFHCSIMRTSVIKRMRDAGIRQYFGGFENKLGEDFAFCLNAKKVGIQVHVDTDFVSGHIGKPIQVDAGYKQAWLARQLPPDQK